MMKLKIFVLNSVSCDGPSMKSHRHYHPEYKNHFWLVDVTVYVSRREFRKIRAAHWKKFGIGPLGRQRHKRTIKIIPDDVKPDWIKICKSIFEEAWSKPVQAPTNADVDVKPDCVPKVTTPQETDDMKLAYKFLLEDRGLRTRVRKM